MVEYHTAIFAIVPLTYDFVVMAAVTLSKRAYVPSLGSFCGELTSRTLPRVALVLGAGGQLLGRTCL